jgi:HK97 family phage prohead protease
MSEINKASFNIKDNNLRMSMPLTKVDKEKRIVSGWATVDVLDRQGDIVTKEASFNAFKNFRNNIREMHDEKKAVGKMVSFKQDGFFDQETGKVYNGIYVSAYVSKGAQDTWEKVLDGTLTGFSIGGNVLKEEDVFDEEMNVSIRVIKEYELFELSLVDNPANQYANVISIEKNHDGGYLSKMAIESVYWCQDDDLIQLSANSSSDCPRCDRGMQNVGFVESNDSEKAEVVKMILSKIKNDEMEVSKMDNEVNETTEEETTKAVEAEKEVEKSVEEEVEKSSEDVEKALPGMEEDEEDQDDDTEDMEKSVADQVTDVTKALAETVTSTMNALTETMKSLNEKVEDLHKTISNVSKEVDGVSQEVKEVKGNFNEFGKRVDAVENDTAFRKSGDLGEIIQEEPVRVQKTLWDGRFLTKSDLFN